MSKKKIPGVNDVTAFACDADARRRAWAARFTLDSAILEQLVDDSHPAVRKAVALNQLSNQALIGRLAADKCAAIRAATACRSKMDHAAVEELAAHRHPPIRRKIAESRYTSADMLSMLAKDADPSVRRAVAGNPGATEIVLSMLAHDSNEKVRMEVAKNASATVDILSWCMTDLHSSVREAARRHENRSERIYRLLRRAGSWPDLRTMNEYRRDKTISVDELEVLAALGPWARYLVGLYPTTPPHLIFSLSQDVVIVREGIATTHANTCHEDVIKSLASDPSSSVRRVLARKLAPERLTLDVAQALIVDKDESIIGFVCQRISPAVALELVKIQPNLRSRMVTKQFPEQVFREWSRDGDAFLRCSIASAFFVPSDVLDVLARDENASVRAATAHNSKTPIDTLRALSCDADSYVREQVARNSSTPIDIINSLVADAEMNVRLGVAERRGDGVETTLANINKLAKDPTMMVRRAVLKHARVPSIVLTELAFDTLPAVRIAVAEHPNCPVPIFKFLSEDRDADVRKAVARNRATDHDTLLRLARAEDPELRATLATNRELPPDVVEVLAFDKNERVRYALANSFPNYISAKVLTHLANDSSPYVRRAVAHNPKTPKLVLDKLLEDPVEWVPNRVEKNHFDPGTIWWEID